MGRFRQAFLVVALALLAHELQDRAAGGRPRPAGAWCGLQTHNTSFTIFSRRVVTPSGVVAAALHVKNGRIRAVSHTASAPEGALDFGDAAISPGLVDVHTHLNEPGRADWEGFLTGTKAAAAGGVTTLVDMPLNSFPSTTSAEAFALKLAAAKGKLHVDVAFWGGLVPANARNLTQLEALLDAGVVGLKAFMSPSGIEDFGHTTPEHLAAAMPALKKRGKLPLMVHAELLPDVVPAVPDGADPHAYATYLNTRPRQWEEDAIRAIINISSKETPIHIAHLADAQSIPLISAAQAEGKLLSTETCPHYLSFAAEEVADGDTRFKCAPPIRGAANREALVAALVGGDLDLVSSDHSPAPPALKLLAEGDFLRSWGGISSLQFSLAATWTAVRERGATLAQLAEWWSVAPALLTGLHNKGAIQTGKDADFVVWQPEENVTLDRAHPVFHRHAVHPYQGRTLQGRVLATFLRGELVFDGTQHSRRPCGRPLIRGQWEGYQLKMN